MVDLRREHIVTFVLSTFSFPSFSYSVMYRTRCQILFLTPTYHSCLPCIHLSHRADSAKMTQPMRGDQAHQPVSARKSASLSSPSAARRLYRNLSGKFRVGTNPPVLEDSVVSGRGGDKERLRKTTIVSQRAREREKIISPGTL